MKKKLFDKNILAILIIYFFSIESFATNRTLWLPTGVMIGANGALASIVPPPSGYEFTLSGGISFAPIVSFNKYKRIYALEGIRPKTSGENVQVNDVFLPANNDGGYRVLESDNISLGLNVTGLVGMASGFYGVGVSLGITPIFGKGYLANRFAPTLKDVAGLPKVKVPETVKMIQNYWNVGDNLSTRRSASINVDVAVVVFAGATLASVGLAASFNSVWNINLAFLPPKNELSKVPLVKLTYSVEKGKDVGLNLGVAMAANFSFEKFWGKYNSISYTFDLNNPSKNDVTVKSGIKGFEGKEKKIEDVRVIDAYQEALKGNLILAGILSKIPNSGVTKNPPVEGTKTGVQRKAAFTIPWAFSAMAKAGNSFIAEKTTPIDENSILEEYFGVYFKQSATEGLISNNMKRISMFIGNFQQKTDLTKPFGEIERRFSGTYKYYFSQNGVSIDKFNEELRILRAKVGFMKDLKGIPIPQVDKIGSLEISLDVLLSNIATDELLKIATAYSEEDIIQEVKDYIDGFFKGIPDAKEEICESYRVRILKECIFTTKRQSASAIKTAYAALKKMRQYRENPDSKEFVKAYADFGKGFIENRFTFKTFLRILKNEFHPNATGEAKYGFQRLVEVNGKLSPVPFKVILSVRGSNISPFKQVLYSHE